MSSLVSRRRRGLTLVLTLLLLAVLPLVLARSTLNVTTTRVASLGHSFGLESRWVAEAVTHQWLAAAQDETISLEELVESSRWHLGEMEVHIAVSASEWKIPVHKVNSSLWLPSWRRQDSGIELVDRPDEALLLGGYTALEGMLSGRHLRTQEVYRSEGNPVLADYLTVWGDGKVDLNRASAEVLRVVLNSFTDAQIAGMMRIRQEEPLRSTGIVVRELSLTRRQQQQLEQFAAFAPRHLELCVHVRKGRFEALYFGVIDAQEPGRVLEVRLVP